MLREHAARRAGCCISPRPSPSCAISRRGGCTARRCHVPSSRAPCPRPASTERCELDGREPIELRDWPGMVGHNWGAEHAERWIWLHGVGFGEEPEAWLDVAIGRLRVAGRMTPWVANGALSLEGQRHRIGGLGARGLLVAETARTLQAHTPRRTAGWSSTRASRTPRSQSPAGVTPTPTGASTTWRTARSRRSS